MGNTRYDVTVVETTSAVGDPVTVAELCAAVAVLVTFREVIILATVHRRYGYSHTVCGTVITGVTVDVAVGMLKQEQPLETREAGY